MDNIAKFIVTANTMAAVLPVNRINDILGVKQ